MAPLGPIFTFALLLSGVMVPGTGDLVPEELRLMNILTYLSTVAGVIVLGSFFLTRIWRRFI